MSYSSVLARVNELQQHLDIWSPQPIASPTGSFHQELQTAFDRIAPAPSDSAVSTQQVPATHGLTPELSTLFQASARRNKVPVELLMAVAKAESNFRSDAVSHAGARGMMQLMPATGAGLGVTDFFDPAQSIEGGARYLRNALRIFDGDLTKTVASYNAGVGAVTRYGGVPPYEETQTYVQRVLAYAREYGLAT